MYNTYYLVTPNGIPPIVNIEQDTVTYTEKVYLTDVELVLIRRGRSLNDGDWKYQLVSKYEDYLDAETEITKDIYNAIVNSSAHVKDNFITLDDSDNVDHLTNEYFEILPITRVSISDRNTRLRRIEILAEKSEYGNLVDIPTSVECEITYVRSTLNLLVVEFTITPDMINLVKSMLRIYTYLIPHTNNRKFAPPKPPTSTDTIKNYNIISAFNRDYSLLIGALNNYWPKYLVATGEFISSVELYNSELNVESFIATTYKIRDIDDILHSWHYSIGHLFTITPTLDVGVSTRIEGAIERFDLTRPRLREINTKVHREEMVDRFQKTAWGKHPQLENSAKYLEDMARQITDINEVCLKIVSSIEGKLKNG